MPSESPANLTARANRLLKEACPSNDDREYFSQCMALAKAQGMTWIEGLAYVIECRRGTLN
jgi:hypothetical protein